MGNVTGSAGRKGIEIVTSNVSIDLMGFTLEGVPGSLAGIDLDDAGVIGVAITSTNSWANFEYELGPGCAVRDPDKNLTEDEDPGHAEHGRELLVRGAELGRSDPGRLGRRYHQGKPDPQPRTPTS